MQPDNVVLFAPLIDEHFRLPTMNFRTRSTRQIPPIRLQSEPSSYIGGMWRSCNNCSFEPIWEVSA